MKNFDKKLIFIFKQLATIDSPSGEEKEIANFVFQYLKNLGLKPQIDKNFQIYCSINHSSQKPILFCAHLDTVGPGRGVKIIEKEGYLMSDGRTILGADNKAAIASILQAISELIKEKINIELLFTVKEETNGGIKKFDYQKIKSRIGFVFDFASEDLGQVILKAPFINDFHFHFYGRLSHASRPEKGINVFNHFLKSFNRLKIGRIDEETTFNLGIIEGGKATNSIPDYLLVKGDIRSLNEKKFYQLIKKIEKTFDIYDKKTRVKTKIEWFPYSFGYEIKQEDDDYLKLKKIYRKNFQIDLKPAISTGGSDASFLNRCGIKTFCLSDGSVDNHTTKEKIKKENLFKLKEIIKRLILAY